MPLYTVVGIPDRFGLGMANPFKRLWLLFTTDECSECGERFEPEKNYVPDRFGFFKSETWTPFLTWLGETHPEDLAAMFSGLTFVEIGLLPGEPKPALSPESIALWEKHTLEFVEVTAAD